jgi:hypothetical protein
MSQSSQLTQPPDNINQLVNTLVNELTQERAALLRSYNEFGAFVEHVEEEVIEDPHPVYSAFVANPNRDTLRVMCNFDQGRFESLWAQVEDVVLPRWFLGRGRKHKTAPKDAFLMTLFVLKHYPTWEVAATTFGMRTPTFEKMINKMLDLIEPRLVERFIRPPSMTSIRESNIRFQNFAFALYANDVKFQPAHRPSGRFTEQKRYFSGKHKLYGFKLECAVAPPGVCVHISAHEPGSTSDLTMCLKNIETHRQMLKKTAEEREQDDFADGADRFPDSWAVLVDKGYQGLDSELRTLQPKKKPRGGELTAEDVNRNTKISSDRVLVENFFGRVCGLWKIMYATFKWNEDRYDLIARACFALTNFHVSDRPLRAQDQMDLRRTLARYQSMVAQQDQQRQNRANDLQARRAAAREDDAHSTSFGYSPRSSSIGSNSPAFA